MRFVVPKTDTVLLDCSVPLLVNVPVDCVMLIGPAEETVTPLSTVVVAAVTCNPPELPLKLRVAEPVLVCENSTVCPVVGVTLTVVPEMVPVAPVVPVIVRLTAWLLLLMLTTPLLVS